MYRSAVFAVPALALLALGVALAGCPVPELPGMFNVAVTGTEKQNAAKDSGPTSLANSRWAAFRKAGPNDTDNGSAAAPGPYGGLLSGGLLERPPVDDQVFVVEFGEDGRITSVLENKYFLPRIYRDEISVGEAWAPATIPFMRFKSASYGVQIDNRFGVATVVHVRLGRIFIGRAIIYNWGTIDGDRIDGTFGYLLDFTGGLGDLLLDTRGDQYPFYATRIQQ